MCLNITQFALLQVRELAEIVRIDLLFSGMLLEMTCPFDKALEMKAILYCQITRE